MISLRRITAALLAGMCSPLFVAAAPTAARAAAAPGDLSKVNHIVVIFEENRAFDNIYSGWPGVDGVAKSTVKQVGLEAHAERQAEGLKFFFDFVQ